MQESSSGRYSPTLTLAATGLGFTLVILDVAVVNVAAERIKTTLGTDVTGLQWVINSYALVFASLLLTAGALGDRLGAKRVFVAGFLLFTVASLSCGMASSITSLVAARIVQGMGAALCVPASLALLNAGFPEAASRARAIAVWSGAGGLALSAGPVVGGILVDQWGWPSIFLLNLPLGIIGILLTLVFAPPVPGSFNRGLDLPGQALAILALGGMSIAFVESGSLGWSHPMVVIGLILFVAAAILFVLTEARSIEPMLPLSLFRSSYVSTACFAGLLMNFSYYGLMFVLSLFFLTAKGYSPLVTGLAFLPMTAVIVIGNLTAGWLTARFGPKLPLVFGQAISAMGYLALSGISVQTSYKIIVVPLIAAGLGAGLTVPAITAAVLANIDKARAGVASGALNAARQTGGVIGVGVFGSLVAGAMGGLESGMHLALILAGIALLLGCAVTVFGMRPLRKVGATLSTIEADICPD